MMAFPDILLAIALVAVIRPPSMANVVLALGIVYMPRRRACGARGDAGYPRDELHRGGARHRRSTTPRILLRHVLRNLVSPIVVQGTFVFAYAILAEAGLSFLGLGPTPETPTWGTIVASGQQFIGQADWIILFPGLAIVLRRFRAADDRRRPARPARSSPAKGFLMQTAKTGFALIGAGLFGERHAQAYSRHHAVDFVAVCDLDEVRARTVAERYAARRFTTSLDSILADPEIVAVSVATPDHAHRDVAVACAKAGKHMLVEKPLATTVADAEDIVNAAEAAGVVFMVDFHNRVNPPMVAAREARLRGDLGKVSYVYARLSNTVAVPEEMLKWAGRSSALWFLGSHMVDVVGWILGDKPEKLFVVSRGGVLKARGIDIPDFHVATVEYAKGTVAVFEHAWILPRSQNTVKDLKLELLGSDGALYVDGSHNRTVELYTAAKGAFPDMLVPPFGPHLTGFVLDGVVHFIEAVTQGKPVLATGREGLANTKTIAAMIEAANCGQSVTLTL